MENTSIQAIIVWLITYVGVPIVAVKIFDMLQKPDVPGFIQNLDYGVKRIASLVLAGIILAIVWVIGIAVKAYPQPVGDAVVWLNAYLAIVWPVGVIDQVWHGFFSVSATKARQAKALAVVKE